MFNCDDFQRQIELAGFKCAPVNSTVLSDAMVPPALLAVFQVGAGGRIRMGSIFA